MYTHVYISSSINTVIHTLFWQDLDPMWRACRPARREVLDGKETVIGCPLGPKGSNLGSTLPRFTNLEDLNLGRYNHCCYVMYHH